jgi:hypothetical protein
MTKAAGLVGVLLTCAAAVHRTGFRAPGYAQSPLVSIEIALMGVLLLMLVAQPIVFIVYAAQKRWRELGMVGVTVVTCLAFSIVALMLDAPTLLYAT